jgi:hypothetical protein
MDIDEVPHCANMFFDLVEPLGKIGWAHPMLCPANRKVQRIEGTRKEEQFQQLILSSLIARVQVSERIGEQLHRRAPILRLPARRLPCPRSSFSRFGLHSCTLTSDRMKFETVPSSVRYDSFLPSANAARNFKSGRTPATRVFAERSLPDHFPAFRIGSATGNFFSIYPASSIRDLAGVSATGIEFTSFKKTSGLVRAMSASAFRIEPGSTKRRV